jgi:hypothetical protein
VKRRTSRVLRLGNTTQFVKEVHAAEGSLSKSRSKRKAMTTCGSANMRRRRLRCAPLWGTASNPCSKSATLPLRSPSLTATTRPSLTAPTPTTRVRRRNPDPAWQSIWPGDDKRKELPSPRLQCIQSYVPIRTLRCDSRQASSKSWKSPRISTSHESPE